MAFSKIWTPNERKHCKDIQKILSCSSLECDLQQGAPSTKRGCAAAAQPLIYSLFKFNSSWRFLSQIVHDAVDVADLIDNS